MLHVKKTPIDMHTSVVRRRHRAAAGPGSNTHNGGPKVPDDSTVEEPDLRELTAQVDKLSATNDQLIKLKATSCLL